MKTKSVRIDKASFKNETQYKKYMKKLSNKHHIVLEIRSDGAEFWFSEYGKDYIEKIAQEKEMTIEELLQDMFKNKSPEIRSEII